MRRENARQLNTHACTQSMRPSVLPRIAAIVPRGPYLSLYDTESTNVAGSTEKLRQSASLKRLPLRLNWLVLLTNSKTLASPPSRTKLKTMEASAVRRSSSEELLADLTESRHSLALRMLPRRSASSSVRKGFPKASRRCFKRFRMP